MSSLTDNKTVRFNSVIDISTYTNSNKESSIKTKSELEQKLDSDSDSDSDTESEPNSEPDAEPELEPESDDEAEVNSEKDQTDNIDTDEEEITNHNEKRVNSNDPYIKTIDMVFDMFINKYSNLDNYKNRKIIYELCTIAVNSMPEHISVPIFYINFLESSIKSITDKSTDDIISD
jgi:hypothetical protein